MTAFDFRADVKQGDRVSALCALSEGSPPFRFLWRKDGEPLALDASKTVLTGADVSTVSFTGVRAEDTGNYSCLVENEFGSDQHTARLSVNCESRCEGEETLTSVQPRFRGWISRATCARVQGQRCSCHAAQLESLVHASRGSAWQASMAERVWKQLTPSAGTSWASVAEGEQLRVARVSAADVGEYACHAVNGVDSGLVSAFRIEILGQ